MCVCVHSVLRERETLGVGMNGGTRDRQFVNMYVRRRCLCLTGPRGRGRGERWVVGGRYVWCNGYFSCVLELLVGWLLCAR